jgi:hypothetical protein
LQHGSEPAPKDELAEAKQLIVRLLADGLQHPVSDLQQLPLPYAFIESALHWLVDEEQIVYDQGLLALKNFQR